MKTNSRIIFSLILISIEGPQYELKNLKTADHINQKHDFSFDTVINDTWIWSYENVNGSHNNKKTTPMQQPNTKGYHITFELNITDLTNTTSDQLINPSDFPFPGLGLYIYNGSQQEWKGGWQINDNGPLGSGTVSSTIQINDTIDGLFALLAPPFAWGDTNITCNATMTFKAISSQNIRTYFSPDFENTKGDTVTWEIE